MPEGFKCSKCGKRSNSSHAKGFINGINVHGYCGHYLKKLQQNTLNSTEKSYKDKYGALVEDYSKDEDGKGTNYTPWIIGRGVIVALVIVIIYLLTRNNKRLK